MRKKIVPQSPGVYVVQVKKNLLSPWKSVSGLVSHSRAIEIASKY